MRPHPPRGTKRQETKQPLPKLAKYIQSSQSVLPGHAAPPPGIHSYVVNYLRFLSFDGKTWEGPSGGKLGMDSFLL